MTGKQNAFVIEYLKDLNATQAAIRAGYSKKNAMSIGCRLVKNNQVSEAIQAQQKALQAASGVTPEFVIQGFLKVYNRCCEAEEIKLPNSAGTGEFRFDSSGANKALENLGKIIGIYVEDNRQKADGLAELFALNKD